MKKMISVAGLTLILAGCSEPQQKAPAALEAPAALPAGLWRTASEVSQYKTMDAGAPIIAAKVGDRSTSETCVAAGEGKKPKPALFGASRGECGYSNFYLGNGTMSGTIECKSPQGPIMHMMNGSYTADTFEASVDTASYLTSDGDVTLTTKLSGTRAGDCPAP